MSFIGATGLNSFEEDIQDTSNYIASRVLEVQSQEILDNGNTSNYVKRLHTELRDEIGYEIGYNPDPLYIAVPTGLYARIEVQETFVGNPKIGIVPASGLFEKIDNVESELSTRIGHAATVTPPSAATGVYVPIEEIQGKQTTIQEEIGGIEEEITTIQGEITTIQGEIRGIETQISTLESEVGASTLLDTFTNFWTGTPSVYAGIASAATLAGTAQITASSANTKADTALTLWNKGTGNYTDNIYHLKSGNVGIGTNINTVLNNKLEVNGSINITTGNTYKINNVDFSYSDLAGTIPIATTSSIGGVKPDGTTITIAPDGTLSSQGETPILENIYPLFDNTQFNNSTGNIRITKNVNSIIKLISRIKKGQIDPYQRYEYKFKHLNESMLKSLHDWVKSESHKSTTVEYLKNKVNNL